MKLKTKLNPIVIRMTYDKRLEELRSFVGLCWAMLETKEGRLDLKDISNASGLSLATLYRYRDGKISLRSQFRSVQALGYAAKLRLELTPTGARVAIID